jgi:5-methylthioadenosine/S-adenosylhomocysteine deaminase
MNLLIDGGTIVTMGQMGTVRKGSVVVEGNQIIDIGKANILLRKYRGYERIDARGKVVIPGLINTHQHAAMSLLRGYADDYPLQVWLEDKIWPLEKHMTGQDIYVGALLTAVESISSGTTTINSMYHYTPEANEAQAFMKTCIRATVGHVCFSWRKKEDKTALHALAKDWHNKADGRIRASVDPHAPYTVDPEYMKELRETTKELNEKYASPDSPIMWHTHVAETQDESQKIQQAFNMNAKDGVFHYLDSLGVLEQDVIAAHCVALSAKDVKVLRKRRVKVSHNPISNLKLASGVCPVPELLKNNITVSLGTDSPCSNNSADMFEVMKTTALLHKGINKDPTLLPAGQVLRMATIDGAKALLWDKEIGSIETGKKADIVIIDFKKPHLTPMYNEASHLVYSVKAADVETVIINGKIVMENHKITTMDTDKVMQTAEKTKEKLLAKLGS